MEDTILYPSRIKGGLLLLVSMIFTVIGTWMFWETGDWKGGLCALFFGAGTVIAVINLLPGKSYLRLTADGFEASSLSRKYFLHWSAIAGFDVASVVFTRMVVFNFAPSYNKAQAGRSFSRQVAGWEGGLHDTFGMKPEKLADLMNTYMVSAKSHSGSTESK